MVKNLNKLCFGKLLVFATIALSCVNMWGCSDDVSFEWEKTRRNAKVVGFVDDSLVMVGDYRFWLEVTDSWNGEHLEESGAGNPRLCVYNYRVQEEGPRWCDSVAERNNSGWFGGQLTDSIVWGGYWGTQKNWRGEYLTLWKIGGKPRKVDLKLVFEECSKEIGINRMHEWFDGKFIALGVTTINSKTFGNALRAFDYGDEYCQYAILDTVTKTITYKRLDKNLDWIELCDDVRAWGKDVYCVEKNSNETGFNLRVNEKKEDSILVASVANISNLWNSFEFCFMGNMLYFGHNINSVDIDNNRIVIYPNIKATSAFNYVDENDNNVNYEFAQE